MREPAAPLLQAVIAERSVNAALDLHNVFGVIDVVFHTLVEWTIYRQSLFIRIIRVDIDSPGESDRRSRPNDPISRFGLRRQFFWHPPPLSGRG